MDIILEQKNSVWPVYMGCTYPNVTDLLSMESLLLLLLLLEVIACRRRLMPDDVLLLVGQPVPHHQLGLWLDRIAYYYVTRRLSWLDHHLLKVCLCKKILRSA